MLCVSALLEPKVSNQMVDESIRSWALSLASFDTAAVSCEYALHLMAFRKLLTSCLNLSLPLMN